MSAMKYRRTILRLIPALWAAGLLFGPAPNASGQTAAVPTAAGASKSTVNLKNAELIARGNDLFAKTCAVGYCHGSEGRASRGPQLRDRAWDPRRVHAITRDGVTGTSMPSWSAILSDHDIWAVTAYVMTLSSAKLDDEAAVIELGATAQPAQNRSADAQKGHDLFFDLTNEKRCSICHRMGSNGTAVGPDLAASAQRKSVEELRRDIVEPGAAVAQGYEEISVATNGAERVVGIRKEETKDYVKLYDTSSIPPPLRTVYREQIHAINSAKRSAMPADYGRLYSREEIQAIVAYLKSGIY
jgi:putative heme-binding domain-containing protein